MYENMKNEKAGLKNILLFSFSPLTFSASISYNAKNGRLGVLE